MLYDYVFMDAVKLFRFKKQKTKKKTNFNLQNSWGCLKIRNSCVHKSFM